MQQHIDNFILLQASPQTQRIYGYVLKRFVKHFNNQIPDGNAWTKDYILHLKNKGLCNKSVNHQLTVIKKFFASEFSRVLEFDRLKENPREVEFLSDMEIEKLINTSELPFKALLLFALDTGCRVSEIASLSTKKFNEVPLEFIITGKGEFQRSVIISEKTSEVMKQLFHNGLIFGRVWSVRSIQYNLNKVAKEAGIKHIHPHMLRHTLATKMMLKDVDIRDIQHVLGHKNLNTTQIYTHITPERLRQVWNRYHSS